jgi:hypothetical protein
MQSKPMADDDDGGLDAYLANNPKANAAYGARLRNAGNLARCEAFLAERKHIKSYSMGPCKSCNLKYYLSL